MNEKWFALSIVEIEKKLKTNAASGLSRKAARSAWYRTGARAGNLFIRKSKPISAMIRECMSDFSLIMLILAAIFAVLFDDKLMGGTVLCICAICTAVNIAVYARCQRSVEQMNLYFLPTAKVVRGGKLYQVSFENVVPGDVILLEKGDVVCGDARLITSDNFSVSMRVDRKKYISLKKQALGVVPNNENNPTKLVNIVHAGSVITEGSARAIVYAVGRYTYLGALTGGIVEPYSDKIPQELSKIKKISSHISIISMIAILPFIIISLLLSHMNGGTATLSYAFLTALAICASSMPQVASTTCKLFFINKIKRISCGKNPAVVRTADTFEKLSNLDYIFMLDGASVTDGVLHFDGAFTAEGEIKSFSNPTLTMSALLELAYIYNSAESKALTVRTNLPERFKTGIDELLEMVGVDKEAIDIRYPTRSYMPGTPSDPTDRVYYSDVGRNMVLCVSRSEEAFSQCSHAIMSGKAQPMTALCKDKLKHSYNVHTAKGKTVLVFSLTTVENIGNNSGRVFVGAVILREGTDKNAVFAMNAIERMGVKIVSFVGIGNSMDIPQIPIEVHYGNKISKDMILKANQSITHRLGEFNTYYGFDVNDVCALINFIHQQKKTVGVIGFSEHNANVAESADLFVSCAPIINVFSAQNEKELYALEIAGGAESNSCMQSVKEKSDIIIQRPNKDGGGLGALVAVLSAVDRAYKNLNTFFSYAITAQLIRLIVVALPMLIGKPILDARHVIFCSFFIDICVLIMLATDTQKLRVSRQRQYKISNLKNQIVSSGILMLSALCAGFFALLLPIFVDLTGVFGQYLYQIEYLFSVLLWLHLGTAYYVRYKTILNVREVIKNRIFMAMTIGVVVFVAMISFITPLGLLFEVISNPLPYFVLSFIPVLLFAVIMEATRIYDNKSK